MRTHRRRLQRVEEAIGSLPIRSDLLEKAFDHFCETGELPEEQRLAWEVCRRALNGGKPLPVITDRTAFLVTRIREAMEAINRGEPPGHPGTKEVSVREYLFDEAVYGPEDLRGFARETLKLFVDCAGEDVTDPKFLADKTLPDHPGVGLHLLGFPERLASPPYEEQGRRLLARYADLRARIDHGDKVWWADLRAAIGLFHEVGDLPADGLMRDAVLADAEMQALIRHANGEEVSDLMSALAAAALATGDAREAAIGRVQDLVRDGYGEQTD